MPCMESMQKRTPLREMVAAEVRAEIARQRRTARSVALQLGWTAPYISRRLSGHTPFTLDDLDAISAALGVPMSRFLDLSGRPAVGGILPGTFTLAVGDYCPSCGADAADPHRPGCPITECPRCGSIMHVRCYPTPADMAGLLASDRARLGLAA